MQLKKTLKFENVLKMFQAVDHSPAFQLKKHYPEIYEKNDG